VDVAAKAWVRVKRSGQNGVGMCFSGSFISTCLVFTVRFGSSTSRIARGA
jgi:hypothetical protein